MVSRFQIKRVPGWHPWAIFSQNAQMSQTGTRWYQLLKGINYPKTIKKVHTYSCFGFTPPDHQTTILGVIVLQYHTMSSDQGG